MLTEERRNLIVSYVNEKNAVTVAELMEEYVSPEVFPANGNGYPSGRRLVLVAPHTEHV